MRSYSTGVYNTYSGVLMLAKVARLEFAAGKALLAWVFYCLSVGWSFLLCA
jgi:hypothetical protein